MISIALLQNSYPLVDMAPLPVRRTNGETWYRSDEDWWAEVQTVIRGQSPGDVSNGIARQAAEQLAIFHRLPLDYSPVGKVGWFDAEEARGHLRTLAGAGREVELICSRLADLLTEPVHAGLPETVCHGDLWLGNWLVDGQDIAGLTDFDWSGHGDRLNDLCDLILAFCSSRDHVKDKDSPDYGLHLNMDRAAMMLGIYQAECGDLTDMERELMPARLRSHWLRHVIWTLPSCGSMLYLTCYAGSVLNTAERIDTDARHLLSSSNGWRISRPRA